MEPAISVIIPVYNGCKYLREAISSVLEQNPAPLEVLVVDDGSSDRSAEVSGEFGSPVRVISQEHRGAGAARNNGVRNSTGDLLAFLDCDDYWAPAKLASQLASFRDNPGAQIVFTHILNFYSPDLSQDQRAHVLCPSEPVPGFTATTMLIRRSSFERIGPFPEDVVVGELVPLLAGARDLELQIEVLPEVLAYRRLHASNLGRLAKANRGDYLRMLKQVLLKRNAEQSVT
jgi:glycosyltransferase involved in cell wall biosynthesis